MKAISYLWRRSIRNGILQAFKKPGVLLLYLLLAAFMIWSFIISNSGSITAQSRNVQGYAAVLVGVFLFIAGFSIYNGLKQGTALFSMADVEYLFTAPVSPRTILLSGIAKQAGIMIFASIFLLFQYSNIRRLAGLDAMALVGLMVSYTILGISLHILSACLYAYSAGSPARRKRIDTSFFAVLCAMLALFALTVLRQGGAIHDALGTFFGSDAWNFVPIIGWARGLAISITEYRFAGAAVYFTLMLLSAVGFTMLLQRTDMDYFEDVLLAAERANQAKEDKKAGRISEQGTVGKHVKREQGALWGTGAFAFTGRLLREQSRRGLYYFDISTLAAAAYPLICMILFDSEMLNEGGLWPIYSLTAWIMIFLNLRGGMGRELAYPVLHLAPASAWKKLTAVLLPQFMKGAVDGLAYAAFLMLFLHRTPMEFAASWLVYLTISMLYAAGMVLVERILGSNRNVALVMIVYMLLLLLLISPGMIGAMLLGGKLADYAPYFLFAAWNAAVSLSIVFLCRNILGSMDVA